MANDDGVTKELAFLSKPLLRRPRCLLFASAFIPVPPFDVGRSAFGVFCAIKRKRDVVSGWRGHDLQPVVGGRRRRRKSRQKRG